MTKRLNEPPIDSVIRLLAQAAGIAKRKRMAETPRRMIATAMMAAYYEGERLRARKRK